jgi:hypothetical protein
MTSVMAPLNLAALPVDNSIHSFLVPWRRAHRKQPRTWKEKQSPHWQEVTCALCLQHKPANDTQATPAPAPIKAR